MTARCVLLPLTLTSLVVASLGACATLPTAPGVATAEALAEARAGDPEAGLAAARLIADHGPRAGTLAEGVDAARAALPHPEGRLWLAVFLEALGRDAEAATAWRDAAADPRAPSALVAAAARRLIGLVDRVVVDDPLVDALEGALTREGPAGVAVAEALEAAALRLPASPGEARAHRALAKARARLGAVTRYRLAPPAHLAAPRLIGDALAPPERGRALAVPAPPIRTPSGRIGLPAGPGGPWVITLEVPAGVELELEVADAPELLALIGGAVALDHRPGGARGPRRARAAVGPVPDGEIALHFASPGGAAAPRVMVRPCGGCGASADPLDASGLTPTASAWIRLELAVAEGDWDAAHEARAALKPAIPLHAWRIAATRVDDPTLPASAARSEAIGLLTRALGDREASAARPGEPTLAVARALVVSLLLDDGDAARASAFAAAGPLGEHGPRLALALAVAEGAPAAGPAATLRTQLPTSCSAMSAWLDASWERLKTDRAISLEALPRCPPLRLRAGGLLREAWRLDDAAALLDALVDDADPGAERARALVALARVALARGALGTARQLAARALAERGDDEAALEIALRAARLAADAAGVEAALAALRETPGISSISRRPAVSPAEDLGLPLADGLDLAERTLHAAASEGSHEILLDDRHTRVFPDGAMLHRVHRVVRLLEANAVDEFGEIALPDDAEVLVARTLKPYGEGRFQPIEPEDFVEKTTISLPALEPGAIAEVAWWWWTPPDARLAPGWRAPTHRFASDRGHTHRSRFTLVAPADHPLDVIGESGAPEPTRPAPHVLVFEALDAPRVAPEPLDPQPERRRPGVLVESRVDPGAVVARLSEAMAPNLAITPPIRALAAEALGDARGDDERLERLFRFVTGEIRAISDDPLYANASHAAARRAGERATLLTALCRAAGLACDLVLVRPWAFGAPDPRVFALDDHLYAVVRARVAGGERWLDPTNRFSPYDHLPPLVQAAHAIVLGADPRRIVTPRTPAGEGERRIRAELTVAEGGERWVAVGEERLSGVYATSWRRPLLEMAPERRARVLEAIVGQSFPGATVEEVETSDLDAQGPLALRWRVTGRTSERGADLLVTVALAPEHLERATVALPSRATPMLVNRAARLDLELRVTLPPTLAIGRPPAPVDVTHPLVALTRRAALADDGAALTLTKTFALRAGMVAPEDYGAWREAARAVDDADVLHIALGPRVAPGAGDAARERRATAPARR